MILTILYIIGVILALAAIAWGNIKWGLDEIGGIPKEFAIFSWASIIGIIIVVVAPRVAVILDKIFKVPYNWFYNKFK